MNTAIQAVALARLVCAKDGLPQARLRDELALLVGSRMTKAEWRVRFLAITAELIEAVSCERSGRGRLVATPSGKACVARFLGVEDLPARLDWRSMKRRAAAAALGLDASRPLTAEQLRVAIVSGAQGMKVPEIQTEARLRDALAWKALGIETSRPFSKGAAQAFLLAKVAGTSPELDSRSAIRVLAAQALGARRSSGEELRRSALQRFMFEDRRRPAPDLGGTEAPLAAFAQTVLDVAHGAAQQDRFGGNKVFISEVFRRFPPPRLEESAFKRRLAEANHRGLLRLSRADLVELMDPAKVAASELRHENATFHFVRI